MVVVLVNIFIFRQPPVVVCRIIFYKSQKQQTIWTQKTNPFCAARRQIFKHIDNSLGVSGLVCVCVYEALVTGATYAAQQQQNEEKTGEWGWAELTALFAAAFHHCQVLRIL